MLIHSVYFWLKPNLTSEEVDGFWNGVLSLLAISSVASGYVGKPADTEKRVIIDDSYDCALIVLFDNREAHDAYQVDAIHDTFRELSHLWDRVQIYDSNVSSR
ncbi:MAG: Dabb family protein [Rhodothermaceae bacterium]|nr:Dabb family protein [Rhodothermaceae bacterium]